jgi:hypothetical protein
MLTFISGWRSSDRDQALVDHRDTQRRAVFFVENDSHFSELVPNAATINVWRHGLMDFELSDATPDTIICLNYDTDHSVLQRAISHTLLAGSDAQIIVTYDAIQHLYRLFPALRAAGALLAVNERFEAPVGDRVLFTRGGSFSWRDHLLESKTALLVGAETIDAGIVDEEVE